MKRDVSMSFFRLPKDARFSNKEIILFLIPILLEQILIASLTIADTFMISKLPNSELALAGIANVTRLDTLFKQIYVALAAGSAVFVAQYIGAKRYEDAGYALKQSVHSIFFIAVILAGVLSVFKMPILNTLFGKVEPSVMEQSKTYYTITILAYPFTALFNAGAAAFRSMGKSKMSLYSSVCMMIMNIALKYVFLFHFGWGVFGAALSLLLAYAITGLVLIVLLCSKKNQVRIHEVFRVKLDFHMLGSIYRVALPTGIENGMFQLGSLLLQTLVASLGTVAIAANHLTNTMTSCIYVFSVTFCLGIMPFVGQCMGAKRPDEASFYIKHILKMSYTVLIVVAAIMIPLAPWLVSVYGMSEEISAMAVTALRIYIFFTPVFYTTSYTAVYALRATGDTRYPMVVSVSTMFLFRIGMAYFMVKVLHLGFISIWIAMTMDWGVRSIFYVTRLVRGKWKEHHLIS